MKCAIFVFFLACYCYLSEGDVHSCVRATRKIGKTGDGSSYGSCMSCDPTYADCATGCQGLIDNLYSVCDGVCLPDGYYFDPKFQLDGCWSDNKADIKIGVERCGCNSASTNRNSWIFGIYCLCFLFAFHFFFG